jgi:hypothetical protein
MYDTRWPRPGPALAAVCAVVGLLVGVAFGLSSGSGQPAEARGNPAPTAGQTTTTLPDDFWTVVLGSYHDRGGAERRLAEVHRLGVKDAAILRKADYPKLGVEYAVYSGEFTTSDQATGHMQELAPLGVGAQYPKHVRR